MVGGQQRTARVPERPCDENRGTPTQSTSLWSNACSSLCASRDCPRGASRRSLGTSGASAPRSAGAQAGRRSPPARSTTSLTNPFYAGLILWGGQVYRGKHKPAVTECEFRAVQEALRKPRVVKRGTHQFAFTGLIRCGGCGLSVTAEHKVNRFGTRYVYYHCSRRKLGPRCREPSLEVTALEGEIVRFLDGLTIEPSIAEWLKGQLTHLDAERAAGEEARLASLTHALAAIDKESAELVGLRVRSLIDDETFVSEKGRLEAAGQNARQPWRAVRRLNGSNPSWTSFRSAPTPYSGSHGSDEDKRLIFQTVGSNPALSAKKLSVEAAKPFLRVAEMAPCLSQLGIGGSAPTNEAGSQPPLADAGSPSSTQASASPVSGRVAGDRKKRLRVRTTRIRWRASTPTCLRSSTSLPATPNSQ